MKQPRAFTAAVIILVILFVGAAWKRQQAGMRDAALVETSQDDENLPPTGNDKDFIVQMIPHHQEAIESSKYLIENSDNEELKKFAQGVIEGQTKEIWTMIGLYQLWFNEPYPGSDYMMMMPDLTQYEGLELNRQYAQGMMAHHQAAVRMASTLVNTSRKKELKTLAYDIINKQATEIIFLNEWLK